MDVTLFGRYKSRVIWSKSQELDLVLGSSIENVKLQQVIGG